MSAYKYIFISIKKKNDFIIFFMLFRKKILLCKIILRVEDKLMFFKIGILKILFKKYLVYFGIRMYKILMK